jgi:outer membrane protein OmpA-like peptidoglycan-associated protein
MKRRPSILAGTALGLLIACGPLAAIPLHSQQLRSSADHAAPLILAQGEQSRGAEVLKKRQAEKAARAKAEQAEQAEKRRQQAEQAQKQRQQAEQGQKRRQQAEQAEKQRQQAEQGEKRRQQAEQGEKRRQQAEQGEKRRQQAEQGEKRRQQQAEQAERRRQQAERNAANKREAEAAAAKKRQADAAARRRQAERDAAEQTQARERSTQVRNERERARLEAARQQAEEQAAEEAARRKRQAAAEELENEQDARRNKRAQEAEERRARQAEEQRARQAEERRDRERRQAREQAEDREEVTESDGDTREKRRAERRLFDSAKERRNARRERDRDAVIEARPLPRDDRDAQRETIVREIRPFADEDGVRVERRERRRERRPEGTEILREMGDRLILQFGDQVLVESDDRRRLSRGAKEVYTEELRNGRTRETIIRPNGTRIVTIRNVYGDVIRRSRFTPDGYEQVLSYVDESDYDRLRDWRDPGLDLPPIVIDIPEEEYILDASSDYGADDYYQFLDQPPVEQVQRLYSVDEVKRSARVRDITRRVDLDTITFEFGSASIAESEIERLESLANAMDRMLKENPAETFLIEGHTDAVGSDLANLALSDRRAEAVALALTDAFGLPPENLTTQGYGEEYLKIDTDEPERENRRVAVRRITPLVAPVASAD